MTEPYEPPEPPADLETEGRALFDSVVSEYLLNAGELRLLVDAARLADLLAHMTRAWREEGSPVTTTGSRNQLVAHPYISESRQHVSTIKGLISALRLAMRDADEQDQPAGDVIILHREPSGPMSRSDAGRLGAAKRWGHVR